MLNLLMYGGSASFYIPFSLEVSHVGILSFTLTPTT